MTTCGMTATVPVTFPGNDQDNPGQVGGTYSYATVLLSQGGQVVDACGTAGAAITQDNGIVTISQGVSCSQPAMAQFSLTLTMCPQAQPGTCIKSVTLPVDFLVGTGCIPREDDCNGPGGSSGGSSAGGAKGGGAASRAGAAGLPGGSAGGSGDSSGGPPTGCSLCIPAGAGCSASAGGGGPSCVPPQDGPNAFLRYAAGGAGGPGFPGSGPTGWNFALGRYWSHDYAERVVIDNSTEGINRVWLITRNATFRAFTNLAAASGNNLRRYRTVAPSDEYRRLFFDPTSGGWQFQGLDGTVEVFQSSGLWDHTTDPRNPGHPLQASYSGAQLASVSLPDGRTETFAYYQTPDPQAGKLKSITEVGVGSSPPNRVWQYFWIGPDLTQILRPDGTSWMLSYSDGRFPGYLTQALLQGSDHMTSRVEVAFDYDSAGNVHDTWQGDVSLNGAPVEVNTFSYNNGGMRPTQSVVTRQLGSPTTYTLARDSASTKVKVLQIAGDCPTCGQAPNVSFQYTDFANPFSPTTMTDARGTVTQYVYDANGRPVSMSENVVNSVAYRTTTWTYDANFPGLPTSVIVPSTSGGTNTRQAQGVYNATNATLTSATVTGVEATIAGGPSFSKQTTYQYNSAGRPTVIDPPGFGTADQTRFTYNVANTNNFLPDSRTDPVVGSTTFGYDPFNRGTSVTDPNGVATITAFDALDRVTSVTQQGANSPTDDLVTRYTYNTFGDLFQTQLPNGNVIEYGYESGGLRRLISIERKADPAPATHGERTLYTLDALGNRVREELQHWNGAWTDDATTDSVYTTRCHVDKVTRGGASVTEFSYDCNNNLQQVWDPNHPSNNQTSPPSQSYGYDALNRLTSVTVGPSGPAPATTSYSYDVQDHLAAVTDAENNSTSYVTGDRDLQTSQLSPVSGTTTYQGNDHGQLISTTDARGITVTRTPDAADRVTAVAYPDASLNTTYVYDTGAFGKGRLASITRNGQAIAYIYDRFGRVTQDGALTYGYDKNGNRTTIGYPGGVTAAYSFDFADRQSILITTGGGATAQVTASSYLPFGPLASLTLGNGLTEAHAFDTRYYPTTITVTNAASQTLLSWSYATDLVGNIAGITDNLSMPNNRVYAYQDFQYFLITGNGPWGTRSWTYDKIGDRLTEMRTGVTDTYSYPQNSSSGDNPKLARIALGPSAGTRFYTYDPAGNEIQVASPTAQLDLLYDAAGQLAKLTDESTRTAAFMTYDGRGFLATSRQDVSLCSAIATQPIYSSDGVLYDRAQKSLFQPTTILKEARIFYFAGRPVAQLDSTPITSAVTYLSADHLSTPTLAATSTGTVSWSGGFEPFGRDWSGAQAAGEFLRFPGQWEDASWDGVTGSGLHYNLNRWYEPATDRYVAADPLGLWEGVNNYLYALASPLRLSDPLGLWVEVCFFADAAGGFGHIGFGLPGEQGTQGFYPTGNPFNSPGQIHRDKQKQKVCKYIPSPPKTDKCMEECRNRRALNPGRYRAFSRQCTSFVRDCLAECGLDPGAYTGPAPADLYFSIPSVK